MSRKLGSDQIFGLLIRLEFRLKPEPNPDQTKDMPELSLKNEWILYLDPSLI